MNRRSFFGLIFALPLLKNFKPPEPKALTLLDTANRKQPFLPVIEALSKKSPLIQDMEWVEDNVPIGHRISFGAPRRFIGLRYTTKANQ